MIAEYRPTTGMEDVPAQSMAHTGAEFEQTAHIVLQAKEQQDTLAAEDAYNTLRQKQIDLTYGQNGIMNQKGAATMNRDMPAEYSGQLTVAAEGLSKGLGNDNQRLLFSKRAAHANLQIQEHAMQHQARESDVYANQVLQGTLDTESRVAAAGGDIPTSMLRITAAIDRHAQRFGTPEQEVTALKMKAADGVWSAKIKGLVYTAPLEARKLFDDPAINAQIGPANRIVLEHELKTAIRPIEAKSVAEAAMAPGQAQAVGGALDAGGEPVVQAAVSTETVPGGVPYSAITPAGTKYEGTAPSEAEALKRVRMASGLPASQAASSAVPTTTRDLRAQLGQFVTRAEELAEQMHPGDALFRDQVISQVKGKISTIAAAFEGIQRQAHGTLLTHLSGGPEGKSQKPTTLDDLLALPGAREAYAHLDPSSLHGVSAALQQNSVEAMGRPVRTDPKVEKALFDRIHLPDDDPQKISSPAQLTQYFANGINHSSYDWLRNELDKQMSAGGRNFTSDVREAINSAHRRFLGSPIGSLQPDKAEDASYKFRFDLAKKIDEYSRTPGKDARSLITPGSPDFMLTSERLASYMPSSRATIASAAQGKLPIVSSDSDYEKLPAGSTFVDKAGKTWEKPAAPAAAKQPPYADFIKTQPRSKAVVIDAAPRSPGRALQGQKFDSREAAIEALKALYEGGS